MIRKLNRIKELKDMPGIWKFFAAVILLFGFIALLSPEIATNSLVKSVEIFKNMFSSLVLAFVFMFVFNLLVTDKVVKKYLQNDIGVKQCLIVSIAGIFSTGPIYMWYAYLSELKDQGANYGLISIFLYNRAIKLPLIPIMISYFSVEITIVFSVLLFIFSFINAFFINIFVKPQKS